jgi:UDP-N-acetylglucosamine:LPS N-acetylglucosamine transferase
MDQVKTPKMILAELSKGYLRKNWLKLKKRIRDTTILYKRRKPLLVLDITMYSLMIGMAVFIFLVIPSLDVEEMKISGLAIITLSIVGMHIYSGVKKYILSKSQRKLNNWLKQKLKHPQD